MRYKEKKEGHRRGACPSLGLTVKKKRKGKRRAPKVHYGALLSSWHLNDWLRQELEQLRAVPPLPLSSTPFLNGSLKEGSVCITHRQMSLSLDAPQKTSQLDPFSKRPSHRYGNRKPMLRDPLIEFLTYWGQQRVTPNIRQISSGHFPVLYCHSFPT